jgi:anionic cell wall polymer biosynthesis LytR-Cps2A-Psr (LCP) family protein
MFPGGPSKAEAVADYRKSHTKTPGKVTLDGETALTYIRSRAVY